MNLKKEKVLVTGASGYIALHCISELLNLGYKVKGSLRDLSKENEVRCSLDKKLGEENLEFCQLNLLSDDGWLEASSDCDYLMHIASPFVIKEPQNEDILIKPAVEGTLRAFNAAKHSSIKKVILTSSMASIAYGHNKEIVNNKDWTDVSKNIGAYIKSKTLSEKTEILYLHTDIYRPENQEGINPFDPSINIKWPLECSQISIKDKNLPFFEK